jgi:hypothetical protein
MVGRESVSADVFTDDRDETFEAAHAAMQGSHS